MGRTGPARELSGGDLRSIYRLGVYWARPEPNSRNRRRQNVFNRELKKGSTELLILSLLESRPRHGYEIGRLIEMRSDGKLKFRIASLYPMLCRLEDRGLIAGRWVEKAGERRRRFYRLTAEGKKFLRHERQTWKEFMMAVNQVTGIENG